MIFNFLSAQFYSQSCYELSGFVKFLYYNFLSFLSLSLSLPQKPGSDTQYEPFKKQTLLMRVASGYSRESKRSWQLLCCEIPGDPKATVVVSRWHSDRSRGYKQLLTGVRSKLFHFQTSRHRSRHLTVRETGALWQALAYPKERSSVPYSGRVWEGGCPSLGLEHRCALLAETRIWEGTGMGRLGSASSHRLQLAMA